MFLDIGVGILSSIFISWFFNLPLTFLLIIGGIVFALLMDVDFLFYVFQGKEVYRHRDCRLEQYYCIFLSESHGRHYFFLLRFLIFCMIVLGLVSASNGYGHFRGIVTHFFIYFNRIRVPNCRLNLYIFGARVNLMKLIKS